MIILQHTAKGYTAKHTGQDAKTVVDLFGTDTILTPYLAECNPQRVLARIQALNPNTIVVLA